LWTDDGIIALTHFENACHALGQRRLMGCGLLKIILSKNAALRDYLGIGDDWGHLQHHAVCRSWSCVLARFIAPLERRFRCLFTEISTASGYETSGQY
jgi:hypothetical protein